MIRIEPQAMKPARRVASRWPNRSVLNRGFLGPALFPPLPPEVSLPFPLLEEVAAEGVWTRVSFSLVALPISGWQLAGAEV